MNVLERLVQLDIILMQKVFWVPMLGIIGTSGNGLCGFHCLITVREKPKAVHANRHIRVRADNSQDLIKGTAIGAMARDEEMASSRAVVKELTAKVLRRVRQRREQEPEVHPQDGLEVMKVVEPEWHNGCDGEGRYERCR